MRVSAVVSDLVFYGPPRHSWKIKGMANQLAPAVGVPMTNNQRPGFSYHG